MGKALLMPGLLELAHTAVPAHLVICGKTGSFPAPRSHRDFTRRNLPAGTQVTDLDGVGHIPMFEAPGRVTEAITASLSSTARRCAQSRTRPPARPQAVADTTCG